MLMMVRRFRPDIMIGLGGISISHAGWLTGRPSISFYAADTANLQTRLTWPFITHLFVPDAYSGRTPRGRTTRFPGVKELSYFHPDNFSIDDALARASGWDGSRENYFVRVVSWRANHDIGKHGWSDSDLRTLVSRLSSRGKVHLSSERPLPDWFRSHLYTGRREHIHHVVGKCRLYVGESATMAHEACLLGVPSIYDGADHPGTTRDLQRKGLLSALHQPGLATLLAEVDRLLGDGVVASLDLSRKAYLASHANLSDYIVDSIDRFALPRSGTSRRFGS
ncbi:MAG: hypothetical protein M3Y79_12435 [Pseudomonadota bacterium]|nr:hypothetical protein [Pseudomonadota bacterium]